MEKALEPDAIEAIEDWLQGADEEGKLQTINFQICKIKLAFFLMNFKLNQFILTFSNLSSSFLFK